MVESRKLSRKCCNLVDSIIGIHVANTPIIKLCVVISTILFVGAPCPLLTSLLSPHGCSCVKVRALSVRSHGAAVMTREIMKPPMVKVGMDANQDINVRARRWRNERNFWISTFIMAMWMSAPATIAATVNDDCYVAVSPLPETVN
jgi:hypothetical protein